MTPRQIRQFNHDLLKWFHEKGRSLPWRETNNPYYIWVSEIMLQQTQVNTVIPYYNRFISRFPTLHALAEAQEESVLKSWEGLGYYSRARNLQKGVREVAEKYNGQVPDDKDKLLSIHGIGPYTAGALLSIAFSEPEPAVDGNVMRVMSRIFLIDDDIAKAKAKKEFENVVQELIAEADPRAFNQSLMDLGAMICHPKNPECPECPVRNHCRAYDEGVQTEYPVKSGKAKPKTADYAVLLISDSEGKILIEQRPDSGLLAGLWQFPMIGESEGGKAAVQKLAGEKIGQSVHLTKESFTHTHRFSHLVWNLSLYSGVICDPIIPGERQEWLPVSELEKRPFPVSHQKVIDWLKKNRRNDT
ncbi:A/G-specific adenine glycosylase [Sporolactobacillus shoreae]|uniref:Adenine DNA glycosylase n=1 Tax=Sporolactobacillus shoreae TaxID=1465501 RepID=A0A4Z0GIQ3_9BACL|nr:A/G-specific adenine glycosylase [Sporolactobacillus shoreae]TGA96466.1 A/G-specific adenine glycosylase [Sporolactobacillus shoreae]